MSFSDKKRDGSEGRGVKGKYIPWGIPSRFILLYLSFLLHSVLDFSCFYYLSLCFICIYYVVLPYGVIKNEWMNEWMNECNVCFFLWAYDAWNKLELSWVNNLCRVFAARCPSCHQPVLKTSTQINHSYNIDNNNIPNDRQFKLAANWCITLLKYC